MIGSQTQKTEDGIKDEPDKRKEKITGRSIQKKNKLTQPKNKNRRCMVNEGRGERKVFLRPEQGLRPTKRVRLGKKGLRVSRGHKGAGEATIL